LHTQERILIEQRVANDAKSPVLAYLLLIFVGGLGIHRFYLGRTGTGIAQLLLFVIGWLTIAVVLGFVLLAVLGIWLIVDLFLIPGIVQAQKEATRQRLTQELLLSRPVGGERPEPLLTTA
jgi:TM2 domain-containing membrane protein YozV